MKKYYKQKNLGYINLNAGDLVMLPAGIIFSKLTNTPIRYKIEKFKKQVMAIYLEKITYPENILTSSGIKIYHNNSVCIVAIKPDDIFAIDTEEFNLSGSKSI